MPGLYLKEFMSSISVQNLHASINGQEIIRGLDIAFSQGEVHAVMGPNGSGKSTLAKVMAGHPDYEVTEGDIFLDGESILEMEPDERARRGLFMAFQYPVEIPGVSNANFLRAALQAKLPEGEELDATDFYHRLYEKMDLLEIHLFVKPMIKVGGVQLDRKSTRLNSSHANISYA